MGNKPLGDAPGYKAGTGGNPWEGIAKPLISMGQKVVSTGYNRYQKNKATKESEAKPVEYQSTEASKAHGDQMRAATQARAAGTPINNNLSAVQHGLTPSVKNQAQRRVNARQALAKQRQPLTPQQQAAASMTRRAQAQK